MAKIKSFFHAIYKVIEDAQMRKALALIAEYKRTGHVGGYL